MRADLDAKTNSLKATQDRLSLREAEAGELESEILRLKAQTGDADTLGVIKRELSEQVAHIRKLEGTNREQGAELKHFRKIHKAVEVMEEEKRVLESKLGLLDAAQKQLREAQLQRQILEDERRSWTSYLQNEGGSQGEEVEFETPEEMAKALVRQRLENASLVQRTGELQAEQLEKDSMIKQLDDERNTARSELENLKTATAQSAGPTTAASGAPTSADSSRTKQRLEKQLSFAKKEVALMREQLRSFDSEEQTYHPDSKFDAAKSARISDLEAMLDDHRRELASLTSELSALETQASASNPAPPQSPLKRSREEMENEGELVGQLSRKNRKLQDSVNTLQSQNAVFASEQAAMQTQLASLQKSAKTRVLSLRSNPTSDHEAVKLSTLETLRRENKDLLASLEGQTPPPRSVPKTTLDSLRSELREREQEVRDKEKRMLRLKQIWGSKTLEFREAVFSLLGWKMEFRPDGKFALSLHTKRDEDGDEDDGEEESLIFDGEKGTMKVSGGTDSPFAREVRPYYREWVERQKFIPGLMASVLLGKIDGGTINFG